MLQCELSRSKASVTRRNLGMNETVTINGMNVYQQDSNGEYRLNYAAINSKINKLYAFQSVNDPVIGPTEDTTKQLAEYIFRKYIGPQD